MKKIREAYDQGANGQEAPKDAGKLRRIAHRLGRSSFNTAEAQNAELDRAMVERFNQAKDQASGPNHTAFKILSEAAALPNTNASKPLWGYDTVNEEGVKIRRWFTSLTSGAPKNPHLPAEPVAQPLGSVHVDNLAWSHNGVRIPVDNVTISCEAPLGENGEIGAPTTKVGINSRPYSPENIVFTTEELTGGVNFTVTAEGGITDTAVTRGNMIGFKAEDLLVDADEFLTQVQQSVQATNEAYRQLPGQDV